MLEEKTSEVGTMGLPSSEVEEAGGGTQCPSGCFMWELKLEAPARQPIPQWESFSGAGEAG